MNLNMTNIPSWRGLGSIKCMSRGWPQCHNARLQKPTRRICVRVRRNRRSSYDDKAEPQMLFTDVEMSQIYTGSVIHIIQYGVFVDIGADKNCLVHVSELSDEYITDPSEVVEVGMPVTVKIINKDCQRKVLGGSLRHPGMKLPTSGLKRNEKPLD